MQGLQRASEHQLSKFNQVPPRTGDVQPPLSCAQVPATQAHAEQRLQEFQTSRDPIPACQHILQHSSMEHARFHAALTLRQAALRDWPLLSPDARAGLLSFIVQHLFGCGTHVSASL